VNFGPEAPESLLAADAWQPDPFDRTTVDSLLAGTHPDPFSVLGPHQTASGRIIRCFLPQATRVDVLARDGTLLGKSVHSRDGLFAAYIDDPRPYLLRIFWPHAVTLTEDPYSFNLLLDESDLRAIAKGCHYRLASCLGAHEINCDGVAGVRFAVWAPNARRVAVIGDFNAWDGRRNPMRYRHEGGVWELFVPRLRPGARYKYAVTASDGTPLPPQADPIGRRSELPPETASVVAAPLRHRWRDEVWLGERASRQAPSAAISIYEVVLDAWFCPNAAAPNWAMAIERLIPYVATLRFTHILLLRDDGGCDGGGQGREGQGGNGQEPKGEERKGHRDGQPSPLFAPPARFGDLDQFASFVDACHAASIGVILDWFPGALASADPPLPSDPPCASGRSGDHLWHTDLLRRDLGRPEIRGFLIASALHWIEDFHIDGLRVNGLAKLLIGEGSAQAGGECDGNTPDYLPAIDLIRDLNEAILSRCAGAITVAVRPAPWPGTTANLEAGGLGFSYQWNGEFANDAWDYFCRDPIDRRCHHDEIIFNLRCAFVEKFVHGISHAEFIRAGGRLLDQLPGDDWQRCAGFRALLSLVWTHPGKKLTHMGCELGPRSQWGSRLDWHRLDDRTDAGFVALVFSLNQLYRNEPALFEADARPGSFEWLIIDDHDNSVFAYLRRGNDGAMPVAVILNMTPAPRYHYRIGVPHCAHWREIFNSDAEIYGGSNLGNLGGVRAAPIPAHGRPCSIELCLPPLAALFLRGESHDAAGDGRL
jgi:1,4-alpha-glucan branching enzyme